MIGIGPGVLHKAVVLGENLSEWKFYWYNTKGMRMIYYCVRDMPGISYKGHGCWTPDMKIARDLWCLVYRKGVVASECCYYTNYPLFTQMYTILGWAMRSDKRVMLFFPGSLLYGDYLFKALISFSFVLIYLHEYTFKISGFKDLCCVAHRLLKWLLYSSIQYFVVLLGIELAFN